MNVLLYLQRCAGKSAEEAYLSSFQTFLSGCESVQFGMYATAGTGLSPTDIDARRLQSYILTGNQDVLPFCGLEVYDFCRRESDSLMSQYLRVEVPWFYSLNAFLMRLRFCESENRYFPSHGYSKCGKIMELAFPSVGPTFHVMALHEIAEEIESE